MNRKIIVVILIFLLFVNFINVGGKDNDYDSCKGYENVDVLILNGFENNYKVQWEKNYGPDDSGGRYQGSQPIGDCDNDGENELLIGGRDATLMVMDWDKQKQTYEETMALHSPFYPLFLVRKMLTGVPPPNPGGFAIGDLTGDGKNEIAVTWYASVYKYIAGSYRLIGFNNWIFKNGGGNGDCYIGDCDNDGQNELIMTGGGGSSRSSIPEVVVFKWNGLSLVKYAEYDDETFGYAFMAGMGDTDEDGENEIIVGVTSYQNPSVYPNKIIVLDWNNSINGFDSSVIYTTTGWLGAPFGGWCDDSDMDGKDEIHVGYVFPRISIFEWNDGNYVMKYDKEWPGEGMLIEGINIGDVDYDGINEVCAGTDIVHILQWDGETYVEEALIDITYGDLAVVCVGDCDNDGFDEINVAPVFVGRDEDYKTWVFKYDNEA